MSITRKCLWTLSGVFEQCSRSLISCIMFVYLFSLCVLLIVCDSFLPLFFFFFSSKKMLMTITKQYIIIQVKYSTSRWILSIVLIGDVFKKHWKYHINVTVNLHQTTLCTQLSATYFFRTFSSSPVSLKHGNIW